MTARQRNSLEGVGICQEAILAGRLQTYYNAGCAQEEENDKTGGNKSAKLKAARKGLGQGSSQSWARGSTTKGTTGRDSHYRASRKLRPGHRSVAEGGGERRERGEKPDSFELNLAGKTPLPRRIEVYPLRRGGEGKTISNEAGKDWFQGQPRKEIFVEGLTGEKPMDEEGEHGYNHHQRGKRTHGNAQQTICAGKWARTRDEKAGNQTRTTNGRKKSGVQKTDKRTCERRAGGLKKRGNGKNNMCAL